MRERNDDVIITLVKGGADVDLQDDWQKKLPKLTVGEPATRTLRLGASGVLAAQLPELKLTVPNGFKTYPDQPKRENLQSSSGITGMLEQKIAMVPTRAGHFTLPAVDLDWWDLTTGQWRQAHLAALDVDVAPAAGFVEQKPALSPESPDGSATTGPLATGPQLSAPPQIVDTGVAIASSKPGIWPWISLGLGLGWLLTLILLFTRRRTAPMAAQQTAGAAKLSEKAARHSVIQAARTHNPQATRQALMAWSRTLWPLPPNDAHEQLFKSADPILLKELETLDLCLYGCSDLVWNGQGMVDCLATWRPASAKNTDSGLPELYPD